MNGDNIIAVNVPNLITIGLMFFGFVILANVAIALFRRGVALAPGSKGEGNA